MYPHERSLVEQYQDRPFAIVGVNPDDDVETLITVESDGTVRWPNFWDGSGGPIAEAWNIQFWPTLYLIDHEGRLRHKNLRDEAALDAAIAALVAEAEAAR